MSTVRRLLYRELRMVECSKSGLTGMGFRGRAEVFVWGSSKQAGEGTPLKKYAYDGTHERVYEVRIPSRVAPQELMIITLVPAIIYCVG